MLLLDPDFAVVTLEGDLDTAFEQKLKTDMEQLLEEDKRPVIIKLPNTVH